MRTVGSTALLSALAAVAMAQPSEPVDREEQARRDKTPPPEPERAPRYSAPRGGAVIISAEDRARIDAAQAKRDRRAARNLRFANADGRK